MNPLNIMKLKPLLSVFKEEHPKIPQFFKAAADAVDVGSIIEITLTTADGKTIRTNMRVSENDEQLMKELKKNFFKGE